MSPTSLISIRPAQPSDAARLSEFARRVYDTTFSPQNSAENMNAYLDSAFREARQRSEIEEPGAVTLLAHSDSTLVGYAHLRTAHVPDCVPDPRAIELMRFYVDPSLHGRGIAHRLMKEALVVAAERAGSLWLGVWEQNARAIAFYMKWEFRDVGAHDFMMGTDRQTDRIMWRLLHHLVAHDDDAVGQ